jgi:hypothetical protein
MKRKVAYESDAVGRNRSRSSLVGRVYPGDVCCEDINVVRFLKVRMKWLRVFRFWNRRVPDVRRKWL